MKRGRNGVPAGDSHHASKLTEETVRELRRMAAEGICVGCAQKVLGLTCAYSTAWDAANYTTWRHVRD
jgi:hypothetical protein